MAWLFILVMIAWAGYGAWTGRSCPYCSVFQVGTFVRATIYCDRLDCPSTKTFNGPHMHRVLCSNCKRYESFPINVEDGK